MYTLYHYYRSSCSYRVRIALNFKKLHCELKAIDLTQGQHNSPEYHEVNLQNTVPALVTPQGTLSQSVAILEYLEEMHPTPALLPQSLILRAKIRAFSQAIACEIHPLNNLRVLNYLRKNVQLEEGQVTAWYQHWVCLTFAVLEQQCNLTAGQYCFGHEVSLADVMLIPQIYNARRFHVDMMAFPLLSQIEKNCLDLPEFQAAHPDCYAHL